MSKGRYRVQHTYNRMAVIQSVILLLLVLTVPLFFHPPYHLLPSKC